MADGLYLKAGHTDVGDKAPSPRPAPLTPPNPGRCIGRRHPEGTGREHPKRCCRDGVEITSLVPHHPTWHSGGLGPPPEAARIEGPPEGAIAPNESIVRNASLRAAPLPEADQGSTCSVSAIPRRPPCRPANSLLAELQKPPSYVLPATRSRAGCQGRSSIGRSTLTAGYRCPTCITILGAIQMASKPGEEGSSPGPPPLLRLPTKRHRPEGP
jgi:hypothetical protein